jgi:hypothetical protein
MGALLRIFSGVALLPQSESTGLTIELVVSILLIHRAELASVRSPWLLLVFERLIPVVSPNTRFRSF